MTETTTVYNEVTTHVEIISTNSNETANILCGIAIAVFLIVSCTTVYELIHYKIKSTLICVFAAVVMEFCDAIILLTTREIIQRYYDENVLPLLVVISFILTILFESVRRLTKSSKIKENQTHQNDSIRSNNNEHI
jgi:hypothetical protein